MSLTVAENTWTTLDQANAYFKLRIGAAKHWNAETTTPDKEAALATAFFQLTQHGSYTFPTEAGAITTKMRHAQCELALFLLAHQEAADIRQGLQAQGVTQAGIVQESYDLSRAGTLPLPPTVRSLIQGFLTGDGTVHAIDLDRDDDEDVL